MMRVLVGSPAPPREVEKDLVPVAAIGSVQFFSTALESQTIESVSWRCRCRSNGRRRLAGTRTHRLRSHIERGSFDGARGDASLRSVVAMCVRSHVRGASKFSQLRMVRAHGGSRCRTFGYAGNLGSELRGDSVTEAVGDRHCPV